MTDSPTGAPAPPPLAPPPAIIARGLTKRYGKVGALDGLDLEVVQGGVTALLGGPGAGRTTAIRLLIGLARASSGSAEVGGVRVGGRGWVAAKRGIGVLSGAPRFPDWMTVREVLAFAADLAALPRREIGSRVEEVAAAVGLAGAADRRVAEASPEVLRRIGIGQALVGRPIALLLDDPVGGLEASTRRELLGAIRDGAPGAAVVITTSEVDDVEAAAGRVVVLDAGRTVYAGPAAEILDRIAPTVAEIEAERGQDAALARLATRLRVEPWVSATAIDGSILRVTARDSTRSARDLLPLLVASGLRVVGVSRRRRPLATGDDAKRRAAA